MSRKDDSKASDSQTITVNVDDYARTRDSVIVTLTNLQTAVAELTRAYLNHTNTVLHGTAGLDAGNLANISSITSALYENGLLGPRASSPGAKSEFGEKKKRKRAPPDPNAPKRALTPYFLYMQHNRATIADELGASARPKDVSDEGTRRWAEMPETQKEIWKKLYADNLAVYKEKVKAYKAGLPFTVDDNRAATQLHQDIAGVSASGDEESDEDHEVEQEEEEEEEEEESSPEPVKEPTPPRTTKRRRSEVVKTPSKKEASPEKKKRAPARKEKEDEQPASTRKTPAADAKRSKKKRKSEAGADE